jgi:xanthine dehydrogenase accessory factor
MVHSSCMVVQRKVAWASCPCYDEWREHMDNIDLFRKAALALEQGQPVALVTVIATTGSTPGKVGYKMLVFGNDESIAGTVGGGLLEAKMIEEARGMLGRLAARVFRFNVGETPDDEKGICGGSVEFLIETFDAISLPLFRELAAITDRDDDGVLLSIISRDGLPRKIHLATADQIEAFGAVGQAPPYPEIVAAVKEVMAAGVGGIRVSTGDWEAFVEPLAKPPTVVLFGAGHVSSHIARYARSVHFGVVICDDRPEYANRERFPDADEIVVEDFGRAFDKVRIDDHSYIVIVTRGHQHDGIVLEEAVRTEARYIGMIGSKRKTLTLLQNLRDKGVPQERLDRVYAPIGVSIGAVTAEEIALSIVSELVKVRRLGDEAGIGHMSLSRREGSP